MQINDKPRHREMRGWNVREILTQGETFQLREAFGPSLGSCNRHKVPRPGDEKSWLQHGVLPEPWGGNFTRGGFFRP